MLHAETSGNDWPPVRGSVHAWRNGLLRLQHGGDKAAGIRVGAAGLGAGDAPVNDRLSEVGEAEGQPHRVEAQRPLAADHIHQVCVSSATNLRTARFFLEVARETSGSLAALHDAHWPAAGTCGAHAEEGTCVPCAICSGNVAHPA